MESPLLHNHLTLACRALQGCWDSEHDGEGLEQWILHCGPAMVVKWSRFEPIISPPLGRLRPFLMLMLLVREGRDMRLNFSH